ncbi:hypothetical protein GCM10007094_00400 [Pseudovibrio japonicus]|uniref:Uncharacterized protein n=1 Tax=Pseudovibrio japonicus TaxID=366534 RepID=A0ABQ3DVT0_9HYPH|nr:hypothetical protein [Pseudovibrio japonicus]GHB16939.1 hypothetical protein GCM10007094_00400 [Pseudovibrio japonicus]
MSEILKRLQSEEANLIDFEKGILIDGIVQSMTKSHEQACGITV